MTATRLPATPSETADAVLRALRDRRSIGRVLPEPVPRETIESLLEAATWAPNHHLTEPWRFWVMTGDARQRFGEAMGHGEVERIRANGDSILEPQPLISGWVKKAHRAPVIIAISVKIDPASNVPELEEIAAGCAAVQNLLLAAHVHGLGAIWRSGKTMFCAAVRDFFALSPGDHLLGFVYLGYPDPAQPTPIKTRTPADSLTTWLS